MPGCIVRDGPGGEVEADEDVGGTGTRAGVELWWCRSS